MEDIVLNSYEELIKFLIHNLNDSCPYCGIVKFKDSVYTVDGMMPNSSYHKHIIKYGRYKFVLETGFFTRCYAISQPLYVFVYNSEDDRYDQTVCIMLEASHMDELIKVLSKE